MCETSIPDSKNEHYLYILIRNVYAQCENDYQLSTLGEWLYRTMNIVCL